jgi:hypothetical protein
MSNFIVEHKVNGYYVMDTITGVEDIDTSMFKHILGIWVCDSMEETNIMEQQLRELRHGRSSQPT